MEGVYCFCFGYKRIYSIIYGVYRRSCLEMFGGMNLIKGRFFL